MCNASLTVPPLTVVTLKKFLSLSCKQSGLATSLKDGLDVQKMPSVGSVKETVTVNYQWL